MLHVIINEADGTYEICDGIPIVAEHSPLNLENLQRIFSREKKNINRKDIKILRVPEKNKKFLIDGKDQW